MDKLVHEMLEQFEMLSREIKDMRSMGDIRDIRDTLDRVEGDINRFAKYIIDLPESGVKDDLDKCRNTPKTHRNGA